MMSTSKYTHAGHKYPYDRSDDYKDNAKGSFTTENVLIIIISVIGTLLLAIFIAFCYKKCCSRRKNSRNGYFNNNDCTCQHSRQSFANSMITTHGVHCGVRSPPAYQPGNVFPNYGISSNAHLNTCYDTHNDDGTAYNNSRHFDIHRQTQPIANPVYSESLVDSDNGSVHHSFADDLLKDLYKVTDRSFTQTVCGKLLVSVSRMVGFKGEVLYLDNMGISLHIPEGAVKQGETKLIALVLNWDLSDNPEMRREQSLVSPVVYVGPHGLKLEKPCTLIFRHCAYNRNQIRVMRSETELTQQKTWKAVYEEGDPNGSCYLSPDECQLKIDTFTLYTCIQTPLDNTIGKKWLQIAVFACPLRSEINHHQVRLYFLNKTNCALQWAIQNEAKFGGKLICPEKVFLFDGNELDMYTETKYMSGGWELVDHQTNEKVSFIQIWHGQCPYISVCFRRAANQTSGSASLTIEMSLHVFTFQQTLEENGEKIFIQVFEDEKTPFTDNEIRCNHHIEIQINNYKDKDCETTIVKNKTETGKQLALTASVPKESPGEESSRESDNLKFVINNQFSACPTDHFNKMISDVSEPRLFPHDLRKRLVLLLDPPKCPYGQDWKDLASKLGMDACIPKLQTLQNPTSELLNVIENQGKSYAEVLALFREIGRMDCVEEIRKYIQTGMVKYNSREPAEHTFKENMEGEIHVSSGVTTGTGSYNGDNSSSHFSSQNNNSATISKSVN